MTGEAYDGALAAWENDGEERLQMVRDACDMLEARLENGYPISACETPEMIARDMIEQSDPWPGVMFEKCVAAVRSALAIIEMTD